MPELPEVEVTRIGVDNAFTGRVLRSCTVRQPRLRWPVPETVQKACGYALLATHRRSKYMVMEFETGCVIVHLGMSGSLQLGPAGRPWKAHEHIEWAFENASVRLHDPRRFGSVEWCEGDWRSYPRFAALGPEPFDEAFTAQSLFASTRGKRLSIKAFLLAGTGVVGVGNIYASESLFEAGIRPGKAAGRLSKRESLRLHAAVRNVLANALARGGSSLRDFSGVDGALGHFQVHAQVYDRAGLPCKRCQTPIKKRVQNQRSTFYCPVCQT